MSIFNDLSMFQVFFLCFALFIAFGFEFINGFHDTANAVATVIYTHSLKPWLAVLMSGICNFLGVFLGGTAVAFTIVHLLPTEIIMDVGSNAGLAMLISLLTAAILWNFATWFKGIPASSSHTLIGSIIGVGLAHSFITGVPFGGALTWHKLANVFISLLTSPIIGYVFTFLLVLMVIKIKFFRPINVSPKSSKDSVTITIEAASKERDKLKREAKEKEKDKKDYKEKDKDKKDSKGKKEKDVKKDKEKDKLKPPPWFIRIPTILSSAAVSFTHGSNDGQKGIGLIMLILIGILPGYFAINMHYSNAALEKVGKSLVFAAEILEKHAPVSDNAAQQHQSDAGTLIVSSAKSIPRMDITPLIAQLKDANEKLCSPGGLKVLSTDERRSLRVQLMMIDESINGLVSSVRLKFTADERKQLDTVRSEIHSMMEYAPNWVIIGVAIALGCGTMIGWKRVVITVGEQIGKRHMTYAQGLAAQLVAAMTIYTGNILGLPVSTTHILSSGVAGGMAANKSGLHSKTVINILLAWILTLPVSMLLAGLMYALLMFFL